jgi:hypothetical protein
LRTDSHFLEHYFQYWADARNPLWETTELLEVRRAQLQTHIDFCNDVLCQAGIIDSPITSLLFIGNGGANGHAWHNGLHFVAWFAIEALESEAQMRVFAMHELLHAVHYQRSPDFYFGSRDEKELVWRQLLTEGIATYLTMRLLHISEGEALWADYLQPQAIASWIASCERERYKLLHYMLEHLDSTDSNELFLAGDATDVWSYRAGYYCGLKLINAIVTRLNLSDVELLNMPADRLRNVAYQELTSLIA